MQSFVPHPRLRNGHVGDARRATHQPRPPVGQLRFEPGAVGRQLRACVGVLPERLPLLWDMDFMHGAPAADGTPRYVLCEINVSSVSPFPPSAIGPLVAAVRQRLSGPPR